MLPARAPRSLLACALLAAAAAVERPPGDPRYETRLQGLYVAEGDLEPLFQPDVTEYKVTVTQESATRISLRLMLNLQVYEPLHCPEIVVDDTKLVYTPLGSIDSQVDIGNFIGPIEKDFRIRVSDPSKNFLGQHPKSTEYKFHIVKPPQYRKLVMATNISVVDSSEQPLLSIPPFPSSSSNKYKFPLDIADEKVTVSFRCPKVDGVSWSLDGRGQTGSGGSVAVDVSRHYETRLVFSCLYFNKKWTAVMPNHAYEVMLSKRVKENHTEADKVHMQHMATAQLRATSSSGYCEEVPVDHEYIAAHPIHAAEGLREFMAQRGFVCRVVKEQAKLVATFSSVDGAAPDVFLVNERTRRATWMPNAVPAPVAITRERQYLRLNVVVAEAALVYPVVTILTASCSTMACKKGHAHRPVDPNAATQSMCSLESCTELDHSHCCSARASCADYSLSCPEGLHVWRQGEAEKVLCEGLTCSLRDQAKCCATPGARFATTTTTRTTTTTMFCMRVDEVWFPLDMTGTEPTVEEDYVACQARCAAHPGCAHFSYWTADQHCHLQGPNAARQDNGYGFQSGPRECASDNLVPTTTTTAPPANGTRCRTRGLLWGPLMAGPLYIGEFYAEEDGIEACQRTCRERSGCGHFQYWTGSKRCALAGTAAKAYHARDRAELEIVSGLPDCDEDMSEVIMMKYHPHQDASVAEPRSGPTADAHVQCSWPTLALGLFAAAVLVAASVSSAMRRPGRSSSLMLVARTPDKVPSPPEDAMEEPFVTE